MRFREFNVYLQVIKTGLIRSLTYKFEVYSNILMQAIIMIASAYFWRALFKNADSVQGVNVETMLVYTVMSSVISIVMLTNVERRITQSVQKGNIAVDMMRPVNIFAVFFAEDIATLVALVFQNMIPVIIVGCLIVGIPTPVSVEAFGMFMISLVMAYLINWLIAVMVGMIGFSSINVDALFQVKKHLIRLLSGSIVPLWFFPAWFSSTLRALPFAYLYQLPLEIYVGRATGDEIMMGLLIQFCWLLLLFILFLYLEKRVTKKVMVQGG